MRNFCEQFCEALKAIRTETGKSQVAFARDLGLLQPVYARYEKGDREPTLNELCRIARVLNTTPNALLGFEAPTASTAVTTGANSAVLIGGNGNRVTIAAHGSPGTARPARKRK